MEIFGRFTIWIRIMLKDLCNIFLFKVSYLLQKDASSHFLNFERSTHSTNTNKQHINRNCSLIWICICFASFDFSCVNNMKYFEHVFGNKKRWRFFFYWLYCLPLVMVLLNWLGNSKNKRNFSHLIEVWFLSIKKTPEFLFPYN